MKRLFFSLALLFMAAGPASATDTYVAQTATGAGSGANCSNAAGLSAISSATAGTTVHMCAGTWTGASGATSFISFGNSGTSGNPITLIADQGTVTITSESWGGPVIDIAGHSYVTVNGDHNLTIQATLNGTEGASCLGGSCAEQTNNGVCVNSHTGSPTNITVEAVNCQKFYVDDSPSDNGGEDTYGFDIWNTTNLVIANNTVNYAKWATRFSYAVGQTFSGQTLTLYGNNFSNMDHGVFAGASDSSGDVTIGQMDIYGNTFGSMTAWDNSGDGNHHDWYHISSNGADGVFTAVYIHDNVAIGDVGANANAGIYLAQESGSLTGAVFNNVFVNTSTAHCWANGFILENENADAVLLANNTFVSTGTTSCVNNGEAETGDNGIIYDSSSNLSAYNNILVSMKRDIFYSEGSVSLAAFDYNDEYNGSPYWTWAPSGGTGTFSTWQADCHCDTHSILTDPNLNSGSTPAYQLSNTSSPAYRTGTNLASLCTGVVAALCTAADGHARPGTGDGAWDMGAFFLTSGGSGPGSGSANLTESLSTSDSLAIEETGAAAITLTETLSTSDSIHVAAGTPPPPAEVALRETLSTSDALTLAETGSSSINLGETLSTSDSIYIATASGPPPPPPPAAPVYVIGDHALAAVDSCAFTLQIDSPGGGFTPETVVDWAGAALETTYVYPRIVRAAIPASDLTVPGTFALTATNTGTGTVTLGNFTVVGGAPTITSTWHLGATLVVNGTNYVPRNTVVLWNGSTLQTTWYSPVLVQAWLPPGIFSAGASPSITISNSGCESD
jgi:hypothetical protein